MRVIKLPSLIYPSPLESSVKKLLESIQIELVRIEKAKVSDETRSYALYNLERISLWLESAIEEVA